MVHIFTVLGDLVGKKILAHIEALESKIARTWHTYKDQHPKTKKSPSDYLFQKKKNLIGHTKSGKPVHKNPDHTSHQGFTKKDHIDAVKLHHKHIKKLQKSIGKSPIPNFEDAKKLWEHTQAARKHTLWSEIKD